MVGIKIYIINGIKDPQNNGMAPQGQMEASGAGVSPSLSASTSIILRRSWGDHVGLALSCLISNGRLRGDSACQPPEPTISSHKCHMGCPAPFHQRGLSRGRSRPGTPALLAFPWHCHRACPAHCQLPTLGQRTQQPLLTWAWRQLAAGYREVRCINVVDRLSKISRRGPKKGQGCRAVRKHLLASNIKHVVLHKQCKH